MFLIRLAVKNLVRHWRRTLITAMIIAWAIFFYIVVDSLLLGMNEMAYDNIIDYESGHLQVADSEYWADRENLPLENLITPDEKLLDRIRETEGFQALTSQLDFQARLNNGVNELPVTARGVAPAGVRQVLNLNEHLTSGSFVTEGAGAYQAVLGEKLAGLMNLQVGDYITLLFRDSNDTFNTIDAEIAGLLQTADPNVNENIVYLPLSLVQQALDVDGRVGEILVRLDDKQQAVGAATALEASLARGGRGDSHPGVYTWNELEAVSITAAKQGSNQLVLAIILLIAAIAIINTVILAALERLEEIGTMKAMGLQVREIISLFVMESVGMGLVGGAAGSLLGAAGVWYLTTFGLDFSALLDIDMGSFGIPVLDIFYGTWHPEAFILVFSFGILVAFLASILPAYWAARKDPVDAIYHR